MRRNTKVILIAAAAFLLFIAAIAVMVIALSPFFNIGNVVSGGK
jgi:hypothetical protein